MKKFSVFVTKIQSNPWYALLMLVLALFTVALLIYEVSPYAEDKYIELSKNLDLAVAWVFLTDFIIGLFFNLKYSKKQYWKHNWLDFVSSIPLTTELAQALRILRAVRALRVISAALNVWFGRRRYKSVARK